MFVNRVDPKTNKQVNEGYCLSCARELNIGPVDDILKNMGLTPEQMDEISNGMSDFMNSMGEFDPEGDDGFDAENNPLAMMGGFGNLFGGMHPAKQEKDSGEHKNAVGKEKNQKKEK